MFRKRGFWSVLIVLSVVLGGAYYYYSNVYAQEQTLDEPTVKTAKVRTGDLTVTATGAGTLVPASEVNLAFRNGGLLAEMMVQVGDKVQAGDVLARLDETDARKTVAGAELQVAQAEANLNVQRNPATVQQQVIRAQVQVAEAEDNLAEAQLKLDELLNWAPDEGAIALAQANLDAAQADYDEVVTRTDHVGDQLTVVRVNLEQARSQLEIAQDAYDVAFDPARDWELYDKKLGPKLEAERVSAERNLEKAQADFQIAQANYNLASVGINDSDRLNTWLKVLNAQAALDDAQIGPDIADIAAMRRQVEQLELILTQAQLDLASAQSPDLTQLELALAQAQLNLDSAQQDLAQLTLIAPVDGTVVAVDAQGGESIGTNTVLTLADMSQPLVEIYMDETDLNKIGVGYEIQVVFDALPDQTFAGHVVQVDPVLVTVDGVPAVRGLAALDAESFAKPQSLPAGLNAAVELISGRAEDALLVPVEALRELAPGEYAVFVMEDGEPKLRTVEVGLMDLTYAEIITGLDRGDIISTGVVETE